MSPVVEVCLVSYASGDHLGRAIHSVARHLPRSSVAVQENSPDASALRVARAAATATGLSLRTAHDPTNPGFGAACNSLATASTAGWLLFLNPDAVVTAWPFAGEPEPRAVLGPARVDGRRGRSHRGVRYRIADELLRSWCRRYGPPPTGTGFVSGAALLVRRDDFTALGGFDPRYFLYYEDIDLCLRANDIGIPTLLASGWIVEHSGAHATTARFAESLAWSYESGSRFHATHGERPAAFRTYVAADAAARWTLHLVRRDPARRRAYARLARRALGDLVHRRPV